MKKIISTLLATTFMLSSVSALAYTDCNDKSVERLSELKIIDGYDDGTFKPDNNLSRAEFAKLVATACGFKASDIEGVEKVDFSDISSSHWAERYITFCQVSNMIDGYDDNTFRPNNFVSYAEAIKICLSSAGYGSTVTLDNETWYKPWINSAYNNGLIETEDIDPSKQITRQEAAVLISSAIDLPLCIVTGFEANAEGQFIPTYSVLDGSDGTTFKSLYTEHFKTQDK